MKSLLIPEGPIRQADLREAGERGLGARQHRRFTRRTSIGAWLFLLAASSYAVAGLGPEEVGIVGLRGSAASREVAEYYAKARGIPASQILLLDDVAPRVDLNRSKWEEQVRPAIARWLRENGRQKLRCLAIAYDVPLRIQGLAAASPASAERRAHLAATRAAYIGRANTLLRGLEGVARDSSPTQGAALDPKARSDELVKKLETALKDAQSRTARLDPAARQKAQAALEQGFVLGAGGAGLVTTVLQQRGAATLSGEAKKKLDDLRGRLAQLQAEIVKLLTEPDSVERDKQVLPKVEQVQGLLGAIRWIDDQQQILEKNESRASFDSELAIVLWPPHALNRWLANPLFNPQDLPAGQPATLMVSRLAAPTTELVKKLIDTSIAVEKTGLSGKMYLDARGLQYDPKQHGFGSYAAHDQSLRDLAARAQAH